MVDRSGGRTLGDVMDQEAIGEPDGPMVIEMLFTKAISRCLNKLTGASEETVARTLAHIVTARKVYNESRTAR